MLENAQVRHTSGPSIASHSQLHTELLTYSTLTKWLKDSEPLRFSEVMEVSQFCSTPLSLMYNVFCGRPMSAAFGVFMMMRFAFFCQKRELLFPEEVLM